MDHYPIDIVVPWVDGSDPEWIQVHNRYTADRNSDNSSARYREWGLFRYWFRCIEKNAPWVRTVHLVTWGHLPKWLDPNAPKLHIVKHSDYIPEQYLPTFSSHTIELNMHRIPGLAEHFIYFNDDFYLVGTANPEDYFLNGLPRDTATLGVVKIRDSVSFMPYIMLNMLALINETFSKTAVIRANWKKWFHPCYGKALLNNLYLLPWNAFTGFRDYHTCFAYTKQTLQKVWEQFPEALDRTCRNRFRSREDVNQYLFRYWQLVNGTFLPKRPDSSYITIGQQGPAEVRRILSGGKYRVVCINDDPMDFDFEAEQKALLETMGTLFPEPSSFEKKP